MRRKTGIVIGACAALVLTGSVGVVAWTRAGERPVGVWHEGTGVARTPVAAEQAAPAAPGVTKDPDRGPAAAGGSLAPSTLPERATQRAERGASDRQGPGGLESTATTSRERVGELIPVRKLLGYLAGPQKEKFSYPGASYVKVHFSRMAMLPGDYVTVSSPDKSESYRYEGNTAGKWAMSITGDTAIVEVHRAVNPLGLGNVLGTLGVDVDRVARGFNRTEKRPARSGREESVCGNDSSTDAVCYRTADPVAYTKSKAIARLLINGTELCTGWRVGAKNRMLTNNHCLKNSNEAYDTEVWFNYQCAKCGGYDVFKPTKVWGDKVLATEHVHDFTLFTVDDFASVQKFGYLTLDTARPAKGQQLYVPQHPAGEPTRIAGGHGEKAGNCAVENPSYTGYAPNSDVSYFCDTAGGSSGSPVLSRATNKVVALHHFGGCPNSGVRGDLLAQRLRQYL